MDEQPYEFTYQKFIEDLFYDTEDQVYKNGKNVTLKPIFVLDQDGVVYEIEETRYDENGGDNGCYFVIIKDRD